MFYHNFKYSLKVLLKNKMLIFWTLAFPIILGTLFNFAFKDIEKNETLEIIDIAIVENESLNNNIGFKTVIDNLSIKNDENQLFNTKYVSNEKAKELLNDKDISGYIVINNDSPEVVVGQSGINETIIKFVVDEIIQNEQIIKTVANYELQNQNPSNISNLNILYEQIYNRTMNYLNENPNIKDITNKNLSYTMIEFYTLIAMSCLYGGILSLFSLNKSLANMGNIGKRVEISSLPKTKVILGSLLASYLLQLFGVLILLLFTTFVLKIDFGSNIPYIILLSAIGSLAGLSLGVFIGSVFKTSDNTKMGILIAYTMLCSFLSGMMGITMKYIVDKNIPLINKINPANMITDGFYALYYYETTNRYFMNIISLLIFSGILILISIRTLRRQKYDSI